MQAALAYASRGWPVFPLHSPENGRCSCRKNECNHPGKHPRTRNGFMDASVTAKTIHHWWTVWPHANIGIPTGGVSGFWVLDVDGDAGRQSLEELTSEYGALPDTVEAQTGGGGRHYLFKCPPDGRKIKNIVGLQRGLDIRGDGGYIVAPPSLHASGRRYEWDPGFHPEETAVAEAPKWLLDFLHTPKKLPTERQEDALQDLIYEGTRNETLTKIAGSLRRQGLDAAEIHIALQGINERRCRPKLPDAELQQIAKSVGRYAPNPQRTVIPDKVFDRTDLGNAQRLVDQFGKRIRYCYERKSWYIWSGCKWSTDNTGEIQRLAKTTVRSIYAEAAKVAEEEAAKALAKHAFNSQSAKRLKDMVELTKSEPGIPVLSDEMDADPWLLNCTNGALDLRTGKLLPHDPARLLSKSVATVYAPDIPCPLWLAFLSKVMDGNASMIRFLQKAVGYALTGKTSEECLFFFYGGGRNGKSTFLETIQLLLSDYATPIPIDSLLVQQKETGGANPELARLKGIRFVPSVEAEEGKRLAEAKIKQLTGGDKISARFLFGDFFDFTPQFKLFIGTNHKPVIRGTDLAIWRRIRLVPFTVTISDAEKDIGLKEKLLQELPGILSWAVEGCLAWQKEGLNPPQEVAAATDGYRSEMDKLAAFIDEACWISDFASVRSGFLYEAYRKWCSSSGEYAEPQRKFVQYLRERGFTDQHSKFGTLWRGLGLAESNAAPESDR